MSRRLKRFLMRWIVPGLAVAWVRLLNATLRYHESGREHFERARASDRPVVGAFLHGHMIALLAFMSRPGNGRWVLMCSRSSDGDAMAEVETRLGFEVVRGSSGSDGLQALIDMVRLVRADPALGSCLAVDGSRGPAGRVQQGILSLAQHTGGSIVPVAAAARPAKVFHKAWDRPILPLPFARVDVVYGEPIVAPRRMTPGEAEGLRKRVERDLAELQIRAHALSSGRR
jgi:lysophospholipid acyltransferase (LPLAT)-like uncharacterized protein